MQITLAKLSEIHPYPKNARKIPQSAIDAVAKSIQEFGWQQPIVVDRDGVIIVGHCRLLAAQKLGLAEAPVHVAEHLTPAQVRQYRLMDNRSHEEAKWDMDILTAEMLELKALDLDLSLTGFSSGELDRMTLGPCAGDSIPPTPECATSRPGDLWIMGGHRLLCGDSRNPDHVARLMAGERAGLMNTDPPYLVEYDGLNHPSKWGTDRPSKNKDWSEKYGVHWDESGNDLSLWVEAFDAARGALIESAAWYVWHADRLSFELRGVLLGMGLLCHQLIIWKKNRPVLTRSWYMPNHESCIFGWMKGHKPSLVGKAQTSTVWEIPHDESKVGSVHPTQKPVELFTIPILAHLEPDGLCYEPFSGSGSQLIAAEMSKRRCYGMEIHEPYMDVIVTRWQNLTGKEATLGDGPHKGCTFAHAKHGRQLEGQDAILEEVLNGAS